MSKSKKPRAKRYDPLKQHRSHFAYEARRRERLHAEALRISGMQNLADDALCTLGLAYHTAFELMCKLGGEDHFHTLAAAINIAGRFCEMGIGDEYAPDIEKAIAALTRVRSRALKLGSWALDGEGIQAVSQGLRIHDAQMAIASYNELREAIEEVHRRNTGDLPATAGMSEQANS